MSDTNELVLIRGDDEAIELTFTDESGDPVDLTGSVIMFTVSNTPGDANDDRAIIKKDVHVHTDPTHGKTTINLLHTDTAVKTGKYDYDIQMVDSDGKVKTLVNDALSIAQDVTKRTT